MRKVLIPLLGDDIAPRFDLAAEVLVAVIDDKKRVTEERTIILPQASAEALCNLIVTEKVDQVICCAIEEEYYQYLTWKNVKIIDSVMGSSSEILEKVRIGKLRNGDMQL
jgi:predicted Fe-Mo cluster-binding NifX family protein